MGNEKRPRDWGSWSGRQGLTVKKELVGVLRAMEISLCPHDGE